MLRVKCPQCAKVLGLEDDVAGKMAKCPSCNATFKVPAAAPAPRPKAAKPAKADPLANVPAGTGKAEPGDIATYGFTQDKGPVDKDAIDEDRVDAMVRDLQRNKKRNAAWEQIGPPAKIVKLVTLIQALILILSYLFTLFAVIMINHQMDQILAQGQKITARTLPSYVWPVSEFWDKGTNPSFVFWVTTAWFVPLLCLYGLVLAGAECMKKLENYTLALIGAIAGCVSFLPTGLLALLVLMRAPIKKEFEMTELRKQGIFEETVEEEAKQDEDDDEDEDEDEDEDDEEDEEDSKTAPGRKGKR
jgi:hypothetical protein